MEDVPLAIAPFQGRVLVGVGKLLRIYDLGKKKLLRKCENKVRPEYTRHLLLVRVYVSVRSLIVCLGSNQEVCNVSPYVNMVGSYWSIV